MDMQLHIRLTGDLLDFSKVVKNYQEPIPGGDREGGFWTSTFNEEIGSDWIQKKVYKPYIHIYQGYLFEIIQRPKIFQVTDISDELYFDSFYKSSYNEIAKDYDGIHLTKQFLEKGIIDKYPLNNSSNFFMWNVECTWWFDVKFLNLIKVFKSEELQEFVLIE